MKILFASYRLVIIPDECMFHISFSRNFRGKECKSFIWSSDVYGRIAWSKFICRWPSGIVLFLILNSYYLVSHSRGVLKFKLLNKSRCETRLCVIHSTWILNVLWSSDRLGKTDLDGIHKMYIECHIKVSSSICDILFPQSFVPRRHRT